MFFTCSGFSQSENNGFLYINLKKENLVSFQPGQKLNPLCDPKEKKSCLAQWVSLARPLSQVQQGGEAQMLFYLPSINDLKPLAEGAEALNRNWMPIYGFEGHTRYYQKVNTDEIREIKGKGEEAQVRTGQLIYVSENDIDLEPSGETGLLVKTNGNVTGIKGTMSRTKEIQEGCVVIDKVQSGFCFECPDGTRVKEVGRDVRRLLQQVDQKRNRNIRSKGIHDTKICHPHTSLRKVIRNFNASCRPETFNKYFEKIYCQSCRKKVPPEVMLALMTVESSGKCSSVGTYGRNEKSMGLFQINSRSHRCTRAHRIKTRENAICLANPDNNLRKSLSILSHFHDEVSPPGLVDEAESLSCSVDWVHLNARQRDSWRRAVSAYNGGDIWIDRAIQVVENVRSDVSPARMHTRRNREAVDDVAKLSEANWEQLRVYYFVEKLLMGRNGRNPKNTIINLAYTEAILGREAQEASRGVVEHWTQYVKKYKPENCN